MNIPECIVAQQLDEILRKVALTIDQQRRAIEQLPKKDATTARGALADRLAAVDRLKAYRAQFR